MPITASNMVRNEAHAEVTWEGETVAFSFYPGKITEAAIERIDGPSWEGFNQELANLLKHWDVFEDDGSMFPLDPDRLKDLPLGFRVSVARTIIRSIRPNAAATQGN